MNPVKFFSKLFRTREDLENEIDELKDRNFELNWYANFYEEQLITQRMINEQLRQTLRIYLDNAMKKEEK
jgi:hypothetical protein